MIEQDDYSKVWSDIAKRQAQKERLEQEREFKEWEKEKGKINPDQPDTQVVRQDAQQ